MMNCIISRLLTPITYQVNPDCQELTEFVRSVPDRFHRQEGVVIYRGRNELRKMTYQGQDFVVKSFRRPNCINRWVYGTFRPSKARRSFEHANLLTAAGIGTPRPIGYIELRRHWEFDESYYITAMSSCPYTYEELFRRPFANEDDIIRAVALTTARMHDQGYAHKDYGRGNILFNPKPDGVQIEIVDLNRMDIGPIDLKKGCKNLERLPATPHMHRILAETYAKARGLDEEACYKWMVAYRSTQPGKIDNLY